MPDAIEELSRTREPRSADDCLALLIHAHESHLAALCRALLRSEADAQDAVQETFARCLPVVPELTGDITPYLNTVARNVCRDELRRRRRHPAAVDDHDCVATTPGPESIALRRDTLRAVWDGLPVHDRRLLGYRVVGYQCEEIARALGVSLSTVTSGLSRAYRKARQLLAASEGGEMAGWKGNDASRTGR